MASYTRGWSKEQIDMMYEFYPNQEYTIDELIKVIGKSKSSIMKKSKELNIDRYPGKGWTKEQDDFIKTYYPNTDIPLEDICKEVGKSESTLYLRLTALGVPRRKRMIPLEETEKRCPKCNEVYPIDMFHVSTKNTKYGKKKVIASYCKGCMALYYKKRRAESKENHKEEIRPDFMVCTKCGVEKPSSMYYKGKKSCKECDKIQKRERILRDLKEKGFSTSS